MFRRWCLLPTPEAEAKFHFKIADTREELEQAFSLVHQAYFKEGFVKDSTARVRIIPHHILPTTTVLVAKDNNKVVGTLSIVRDSHLGLPVESHYSLQDVRARLGTLAELNCLAVDPSYRRSSGGNVLFPLFKFMRDLCETRLEVKGLVSSILPKDVDFYIGIFGFEKVTRRTFDYHHAPTHIAVLDLTQLPLTLEKLYGKVPKSRNIYDYFILRPHPTFHYPTDEFLSAFEPSLNVDTAEYFFADWAESLHDLGREGIYQILSEIQVTELGQLIMRKLRVRERIEFPLSRSNPRFPVRGRGKIFAANIHFPVVQVSRFGFYSTAYFGSGIGAEPIEVSVQVSSNAWAKLKTQKLWENEKRGTGFKIVESDDLWQAFILHLESKLRKQNRAG